MKVRIEIDAIDLRSIVAEYISNKSPTAVDPAKITIEVKSKQNHKSEWERAEFRAVYEE